MKRQLARLIFAVLALSFLGGDLYARRSRAKRPTDESIEHILDQKLSRPAGERPVEIITNMPTSLPDNPDIVGDVKEQEDSTEKKIDVHFDAVDLTEVINTLAAQKGVNVILPTGDAAIKSKITLTLDDRLPVSKAWKLLYTILDVAGYTLMKKADGYVVIKNDKDIERNPLPIYIGVSPDDLPSTDKRIRYIYYLANIQVPKQAQARQSEINSIFTELLPKGALFRYLPTSNGVLLVEKANNIKAVMKIILELDKVGFREHLEIIKLRHASADIIEDLFTKNILAVARPRPGPRRVGWRGQSKADYFSKNMKIIKEPRTNSLLLLGRKQAIDRVREFIVKYIDVELDSGKSILHTHQLQYLDAAPFAKTLENIVAAASTRGTGQSRASGTAKGPERFFEGVIIKTDTPASARTGSVYFGGNRLVIAARNDDWLRIKKLIEELDRPQPQVIIEVLIADLEIKDERYFGSHTRTPAALNLPNILEGGDMQFQSAQPAAAVATAAGDATSNLHVDLMGKYVTTGDIPTTIDPLATVATGGSGIISLSDNDGNTWSILKILQTYDNSKILSHPHIISTNNQKATVTIGETRLLRAEATVGTGGAVAAKRQEKNADLKVEITPRISAGNTVNLQVLVDFKEFIGDSNTRIDRNVTTNANVKSGSILALGGLIKIDTSHGTNQTPLLGRIPLIGWLFKRKSGRTQKNNLTVFIRPTIIQPRLRGGLGSYTKDYIKVAKEYVNDGMLFDTLRDPITRWFFKTGVDAEAAIDVFASEDLAGRHGKVGSIDLAENEVPMPQFRKDPNTTVLAAAEGRAKPRAAELSPTLELKSNLMDYPGVDHNAMLTKRKKRRRRSRKKMEMAQAKKAARSTKPVKVAAARPKKIVKKKQVVAQSLSPEEKLKKMLANEQNPLLS
ncbi:hypothetical protein ACFLX2_01095 [Candidatus Dependentiae bacterium]